MSGDPFAPFDGRTAEWFRASVGEPTDVQERTWRAVAAGKNVLATAPTGSGKTLAAFLWALDALATGKLATDRLSVLYLSPLKALNNDIRRNLLGPLAGLRRRWLDGGEGFPDIRVATRSGDTTAAERRAFLKEPPAILATTPESLALLLNSPRARGELASVRVVVLDEIHALAPSKRGAFLMAQVERLSLLSGEFRRIALSATVADPEGTARFACGYAGSDGASPEPREFELVRSAIEKKRSLSIFFPSAAGGSDSSAEGAEGPSASPARWPALVDAFVDAVSRNRTTLIFTNSRRNAEKIAFLMNERSEATIAWAHHGSLSREVRSSVEERLKTGELPAVVATSSLELGIDVGAVDEVILAGTPAGAAATLQRVGRAGHRLGAESRGRLYPLHGLDLLLAAAVARDVAETRLEREARPRAPLDVLAQLILSMTALDAWRSDDLYRFFLRTESFRALARSDFDLVVAMLRGRYAGSRMEALKPRLERTDVGDAADDPEAAETLRARSGSLPLLYRSGGVIPDRGSFVLRLAENGANLGELDEEFVWERRLGDTFSLGTRSWRIVGIDDRSVSVVPWDRAINIVPFWRAENQWRSEEAMATVLELLDGLPATADPPASVADGPATAATDAAEAYLRASWGLGDEAARSLARFLALQRAAAGLPGRDRVVLESFRGPGGQGSYCFLHTLRGGRLNAALGTALRAAADERFGSLSIEFFWDDAGILAAFPALEEDPPAFGSPPSEPSAEAGPESIPTLLADVGSRGVSAFLRKGLESTQLFGAAFREAAGRALLLPKASFGKRTPLWMSRLRSRRLYDAVRSYPDFPMMKEAWRTCLEDILDVAGSERLAADIASGAMEMIDAASAAPSPLARGSVWLSSDSFMYRRDDGSPSSSLSDELLGELLGGETAARIEGAAAEKLVRRIKRLEGDYVPRNSADLADWLDERLLIAADEWAELLAAATAAADAESEEIAVPRARPFLFPGSGSSFVVSPDFQDAADIAAVLPRWLRYEGPVSEERIADLFSETGVDAVRALLDEGAATRISLADGEPLLCDAEVASRLLRFARSERRRSRAAERPLADLQAVAAFRSGVIDEDADTHRAGIEAEIEAGVEALQRALEGLLGSAFDTELWEREILPARSSYRSYHLELLLRRGVLVWYGAGNGRAGFALDGELELSDIPPMDGEALSGPAKSLLAATRAGSGTLGELASRAGLDARDAEGAIRELVSKGYARTDRFADAAGAAPADKRLEGDRKESAQGAIRADVRSALAGRTYGSRSALRGGATGRSKWTKERAGGERWFALDRVPAADPLAADARLRERARRLLGRFGILCRSVAALDEGAPPWSSLFRALRLMEFAGEVIGGRFYEGLDELQFVRAEEDSTPTPRAGLYCLCARDPASLCALQPLAASLRLPSRLASNHVVWRGSVPLLVSRRNGRDLDFRAPPDAADATSAVAALARRLTARAVDPLPRLLVETVGDEPAARSPYAPALRTAGFVEDVKGLSYHPRGRT